LLKEGQDDPSGYPAEANLEVLPWALGFEEMQEDIYGGGVTEVIAEDLKALMKAQLLGCSWAGATLISVRSSLSKLVKGRRCSMPLNTVW